MLLDKITKESAEKAIKAINSSNVRDSHWKEVLINHINTCLCIATSNLDGFKYYFGESLSSRYFAFQPPEIEPTEGKSIQLEEDLLKCSKVYIDFQPRIKSLYIADFKVSIFHLLHEKSRNVQLYTDDWNFSKGVCDYIHKFYSSYFLEKSKDYEYFDNISLSLFLDNFKSFWQHYVHMLDGFSDVVNYDFLKKEYTQRIDDLFDVFPDKAKKTLNFAKRNEDILFVRSKETFKLLSQDISPFSLLVTFPRFDKSFPDVFFENAYYLIERVEKEKIKSIYMVQFYSIYKSFKNTFINERGVVSYSDWCNAIEQCKLENKSPLIAFFDLVNNIFLNRMVLNGYENLKIDSTILLFLNFDYNFEMKKEIINADVISKIENSRNALIAHLNDNEFSSFIDFCKELKAESFFYQILENKKMLDGLFKKEDNQEVNLGLEDEGFKI